MTFYAIDVSKWNETINYAAVRAGGIQGVVCKATNGTPAQTSAETVPYFLNAAKQISRQGFPVRGGYHWLYPGNYAAQAAHFRNALVQGFGSLDGLTLQLDAEGTGVRLVDVQGFVRAWNLLTGGYPLCGYFPKWYWNGLGVGPASLLPLVGGRWWQSTYVTGSGSFISLAGKIGPGWAAWGGFFPLLLQFTSSANIPGDPGVCDVNQIRSSVPDFLARATQPKKPPPPKPIVVTPEVQTVRLIMEAKAPAVYLALPDGTRRYVDSPEYADMKLVYGEPVIVADVDHFGPVVELDPVPTGAERERMLRRRDA